ncbi:MAG TPA: hypothetical protein VHT01_05995 [Candidatus Udaeobacter sp.]|nr:hypothetical protein [Candidatus Udaeobacter sp.]
MTKRICHIHAGPHKTGTTSIQWFLQENRAELLNDGYFVPESETKRGSHHALVEGLAGLDVGEHRESLVARSIAEIAETPAQAIIISSEALEGLFRNRQNTKTFFNRIHELNLQPKLILFPRNQSQWINSSYSHSVKAFRRSDSFESGAFGFAQSPDSRFSRWIELAETHGAELIARPFNKETLRRGVIPEFLDTIGITSSQFRDRAVRRNEAVGPFTVSVAREVLRSVGKEMTWLQAKKCKVALAEYLRQNNRTDTGYCGLSTALARHIEEELRSDNDLFARGVWGKLWADVFAADVTEQFTPNDFEVRRPDWFTTRRLRSAIAKMTDFAYQTLRDPALAVEAPWNVVAYRSGLVSRD